MTGSRWRVGFGYVAVGVALACAEEPADPFTQPGDTDEPSVEAEPCGPCGSGTTAKDGTCVGALATPVEDLVGNAGTIEASTIFDDDRDQYGPELARDGDPATSWFSSGPDNGTSELVWTSTRNDCITAVRIRNNTLHDNEDFRLGFGFGGARIRLFQAGSTLPRFEAVADLSGSPDPDVDVEVTGEDGLPGVMAGAMEIVFSGHEDPTCGGVSEVGVSAYLE